METKSTANNCIIFFSVIETSFIGYTMNFHKNYRHLSDQILSRYFNNKSMDDESCGDCNNDNTDDEEVDFRFSIII